jgi:hypothetical protein
MGRSGPIGRGLTLKDAQALASVSGCPVEAESSIRSERFVNEEGSEFVTVYVSYPGTDAEEERTMFASYFDDLGPSASEQAASFVDAMIEAEEYTLEQRLGPYGLEWEREQEERRWGS